MIYLARKLPMYEIGNGRFKQDGLQPPNPFRSHTTSGFSH